MTNWINQNLDELDFKFRVGDSILTEFVRGHDPAAVLQELVQNEYDAGGKWLDVSFGESALVIKGNGTPIDRKGWIRLSPILGTGRVAGSDHEVEAKKNGIGSKNFGLRSLFLFGDTIFIQSGGKKSVLNIRRGALPFPLTDPDTAKARGVTISVPYLKLGAYSDPTDYHWEKLLTWIGESFKAEQRPLSTTTKKVVRQAYAKFSGDPDLPPDLPWLLDDAGQLHTRAKSSEKAFLIDDDIGLSEAIRRSNSPVVFADVRERQTIQFYHRINVRSLTEERQRVGEEIGDEHKPPHWFRSEKYLERLTRGAFGDALKQLAAHDFRRNPTVLDGISSAVGQLRSINQIKFVERLSLRYRVGLITASVPVSAIWRDDVICLTAVKSRSDLYDFLAFCIAERFPIDVDYQRRFSDTLYRLITCESTRDIRRCLEMKGINWRPEYVDDEVGDDEDAEDELNDLVEMNLIENIRPPSKDTTDDQPHDQANPASVSATEPENDEEERFVPLPPFDEVTPALVEPTPDWSHPSSSGSGGGSGGGIWSPPNSQDKKRDEEIGRRGEEIVLKLEMDRVRRVGLPTDKVIWISKTNPMADHDIRSIDDDGKELIIEVKSTSGEGGRFQWSKAEFQRALSERRHYILYRVYNAGGKTPTVRAFRDPVALLRKGALRLDFENLRAEIESL